MQYTVRTMNSINFSAVQEMPTLNINAEGSAVILLQKLLLYFGYLTCDALTGYFGSKTAIAVKNFQLDSGLPSDGVVNQQTWKALIENLPTPD